MNIDNIVNTINPISPNLKIISKVASSGIGIFAFSAILKIINTNIVGVKNIAIITTLAFSTPVLNTIGIIIENNMANIHGTIIDVTNISSIPTFESGFC